MPTILIMAVITHIYTCSFVTANCIRISLQCDHGFKKVGISLILVGFFISTILLIGPKRLLGIEVYYIPTNSMVPAIYPGDVALVDATHLAIANSSIGDIVAFSSDQERSTREIWIKRIVVMSQNSFDAAGDNVLSSIAAEELKDIPLSRIVGVGKVIIGKMTSEGFTFCYRDIRKIGEPCT